MKRKDADIIEDLRGIECQLSPENLSCDGECSMTEYRRREISLLVKRKRLVAELGRQPTHSEIYG